MKNLKQIRQITVGQTPVSERFRAFQIPHDKRPSLSGDTLHADGTGNQATHQR